MEKNTIPVELDKTSVRLMLRILDKHAEKYPLGTTKDKESYNETYTKLKVALFELTFMDGP